MLRTDSAEVADHLDVRKFADDTAMQAAAMSPLALRRQDVDEEQVAKQSVSSCPHSIVHSQMSLYLFIWHKK